MTTWTPVMLLCTHCNRPTPAGTKAESITCGRCASILAAKAGPQRLTRTPEQQAMINRAAHRRRVRGE